MPERQSNNKTVAKNKNSKQSGKKKGKKISPPKAIETSVCEFKPLVSKFLDDKRFDNQKVTVSIDKDRYKTYLFKFELIDKDNLTKKKFSMSLSDYQQFISERAKKLRIEDQEKAFSSFINKVKFRLKLDFSGSVPSVLGEHAQRVIFSVLSPPEKDLLSLSQKDWDNAPLSSKINFLGTAQSAIGDELNTRRTQYVLAKFKGEPVVPDHPIKPTTFSSMGLKHISRKALLEILTPPPDKVEQERRLEGEGPDE